MPKIKYKDIRFTPERKKIVEQATALVTEYLREGYSLSLRQLFYRYIAGDLFPASWADPVTKSTNNEKSYKKLGDVIADARMAGLIDWTAIEDRGRSLAGDPKWDSPASIVQACAEQFQIDRWSDQKYRVECFVEKDALKDVVGRAARECGVSYFSCRGYTSMTAIWDAGQRLKRYVRKGQIPVILHLGDLDPSGVDMSRDIGERVAQFMDGEGDSLVFERIALNEPQVEQYNPPPNPAKVTDSRFKAFQEKYGDESWELDALDPRVLNELIVSKISKYRDAKKYRAKEEEQEAHRNDLLRVSRHWDQMVTDSKEYE